MVRNEGESVEGTTVKDIGREVSIIVDKGNAGDLTCTKSHKHRRSDKENADTWTRKKSKVSFQMRILPSLTVYRREWTSASSFMLEKKRSTVKISVKIA